MSYASFRIYADAIGDKMDESDDGKIGHEELKKIEGKFPFLTPEDLLDVQPVSKEEVAAIEQEFHQDRRLYIIAPTYHLAVHYARRHAIGRRRLIYISQESQLYGLSGEAYWVTGDSNAPFNYSHWQWEMLRLAWDMDRAKRITLRSVKMEEAPFREQ